MSVCPSVRRSVCPSVRLSTPWGYVCTDDISLTLQPIHFSFCIWKDHILELCDEGLFFDFLQNWKNAKSLKIVDFGLSRIT